MKPATAWPPVPLTYSKERVLKKGRKEGSAAQGWPVKSHRLGSGQLEEEDEKATFRLSGPSDSSRI